MRTAIGLTIVAVILIGLPLVAWAVGGRLPLPRPAKVREDASTWLVRALGVTGLDHAEVVDAVAQGRRVDPRLRPAAVAYGARLEQDIVRQTAWARRRWVLALWSVLVVAAIGNLVLGGLTGAGFWSLFYVTVWPGGILLAWQRRLDRVRRAVAVNSTDTPEGSGAV